MTPEEYRTEVREGLQHVSNLTRLSLSPESKFRILAAESKTMRSNEDAQIYKHLDDAFKQMVPEFSEWTAQGHRKTIRTSGYQLHVTVVHRNPLETISGADVLYEIEGIKVALFQHKKRNSDGALRAISGREDEQLRTIKSYCNNCRKSRIIHRGRFVRYSCAAMYVIGDDNSSRRHVMSACQLSNYKDQFRRHSDHNTQYHPMTIDDIDLLFVKCDVGLKFDPESDMEMPDKLQRLSLASNHVLIGGKLSVEG